MRLTGVKIIEMVNIVKIQCAMSRMSLSVTTLAILCGSTPKIITRITKQGRISGRDKKTIARLCSILGLDLDDFKRGKIDGPTIR
jgi:hypothetical protein